MFTVELLYLNYDKDFKMAKKMLIVAAHPDDEILGCGGTIARLVKGGYEAYTMILGEGITSRDETRVRKKRKEEISQLKKQVHEANKIIGIKEVFIYDLPDNRFDSVPLLDIVKLIEKVKNKLKPDILFTHYEKDLNIDHQLTYHAVMTAARPLPGETVKEIYSFEVLSATEWKFPLTFSPDCFFDITATIDIKTKAMEIYQSELRAYPHPRSLKGLRLNAENWGMKVGIAYAEAFKTVRVLK
jgi:LmbE family N-acetylglucosaminyl deacetylase